jgi:hypothetical protein
LPLSPFTRSPGCNTKKIAFAVCADGQFDDARCKITLMTSFTIAFGNAVNDARVTGFQCEATGQISDVVGRETAKQFPRTVSSQKAIPTGQREVHRVTVSRDVGDPEWLRHF